MTLTVFVLCIQSHIKSLHTEPFTVCKFKETSLDDVQYMEFSGFDVTHAILKFNDDLGTSFKITVKTLSNTTGIVYSKKTITFPEKSSDDYINPVGNFIVNITYGNNKKVSGIVFTQQK